MAMLLNKRKTPGSRVQDGIRRGLLALGMDNYGANKWAHRVTSPLLALTPLGAAEDAVNTSREYAGMMRRGQQVPLMGGAPVAMAALGAVPGGRAVKAAADLPMDTASRMARARAMGFTEPFNHGSPDMRALRASQEFEPRSYAVMRGGDWEKVRQPIYGSPDAHIYRSYANPQRAFDYRNAEPGVFEGVAALGNSLQIDAGGQKFSQIPIDKIRAQIPPEKLQEFDEIVTRYVRGRGQDGNTIRTGDLEIVAQKLGYDSFVINRVKDTHDGTGKPGKVIAVFDPSNLRSVNAAFDPAKRNSANIMAGIGGVGILGAGMMPAEQQQPQGQRIY